MKKFTLLLAMFLFLGATSISFVSCSDDDDDAKSCTELAQAAADAGTAFTANPTDSDLCNAYKEAINDMLDGCDEYDQATIDQWNATLDLWDCDNLAGL